MKLTKKAASLLLAASLAVSVCAMPVFATGYNMGSQEVDNKKNLVGGVISAGTTVLYNVTESYSWSVPITIDFGEDAGVNNTSTVEAKLSVKSDGEKAVQETGAKTWKGTAPKVMVTKNVIGVDKTLEIHVATDDKGYTTSFDTEKNQFYVTSGSEDLYFTITKSTTDPTAKTTLNKDNNVVMTVPAGTNEMEQVLEFKLSTTTKDTAEKAGKYEGHVVFYSKLV